MDPISSPQNTKVKLVGQLQRRSRTRYKEERIVLEGARLIQDAWENGADLDFLLYTPDNRPELVEQLQAAGTQVLPVTEAIMQSISDTRTPQGVLAVVAMPSPLLPDNPSRLLILDGLKDPGNVGTLLRTAAGAGCDGVILAPGTVDAYNPKVLRAGMGAHFRLPVVERSWDEIGEMGLEQVYLAVGEATDAYDAVNWRERWALVIGSEAHGAGEAARVLATSSIMIPMAHETESLNAATAAAVILFEAARQRRLG
jgi:TrmH family RNA methyltransferase